MITSDLEKEVALSLQEDLGDGDITALLIPPDISATATIISREKAVLCGSPWVNTVYQLLDPTIQLAWQVNDGDRIYPEQVLVTLFGSARNLLSGERTALNWLQTLSGTATTTHAYQALLSKSKTQLLDTRKTVPGLRLAQKYAVRCGGGHNHRMGLYDAYLIKENHIISTGSIANAIALARQKNPDKTIEIEVENLQELQQALDGRADIIMLDNFDLATIKQAVQITAGRSKLEVSGNVNLTNLSALAATGVDYISVGALSKHIRAIDLSMRFMIAS